MQSRIATMLLSIQCLIMTVGVACSTAKPVAQKLQPLAASSPTPNVETPSSAPSYSIRSVDFSNFTYSWIADLGNPKKTFTLQNGELPPTRNERGLVDGMGVSLERVEYGDVTGDGQEEAIVVLSILTGGSATPHAIYVYGRGGDQTKLLWSGSTDDRADGGLQKVYAQNGELVLERFSPVGKKGDCCPTRFTRVRYEWRGHRFHQKGKEETWPIPE